MTNLMGSSEAEMVVIFRGMVAINNMGVKLLQAGCGEAIRSAIRTLMEALNFVLTADQHLHHELEHHPIPTMTVENTIKLATSQVIQYYSSYSQHATANGDSLSLHLGEAIVIKHGAGATSAYANHVCPLHIELEDFGTLYPTNRDLEFLTVALLYNLGVSCLQLSKTVRSENKADHHMMDISVVSASKVLQLARTMLCSIQFDMCQGGNANSYTEACCFQLESRILQIMLPAFQSLGRTQEAGACSQRLEELAQMIHALAFVNNILPVGGAGAA